MTTNRTTYRGYTLIQGPASTSGYGVAIYWGGGTEPRPAISYEYTLEAAKAVIDSWLNAK